MHAADEFKRQALCCMGVYCTYMLACFDKICWEFGCELVLLGECHVQELLLQLGFNHADMA